jgi:DNA-binding NarL/FixJ family response regulator
MDKINVLVVDDSAVFRESIVVSLQGQDGVEIIGSVTSGEECLDFVKENPIDLILMDVRMPGLDGPQTTSELKKRYPDIKVIVCTIWPEKETRNYALQAGADDYFIKGEPLAVLKEKIYRLFPRYSDK